MRGLIESAAADPWGTLGTVLDGPLHPGGLEATDRLLDRAGVESGVRLLDIGCGGGESLALARERGAEAVGLDSQPRTDRIVRGDMSRLPFAAESFGVALSECVLCLSADHERAFAEAARVLEPGGRLAVSDVVIDGEPPAVPAAMTEALCLGGHRDRTAVLGAIDAAGFGVETVRSHREDLLAMRDELAEKVAYERMLELMGPTGTRALEGIEAVETAVEDGRLDYVSLVARKR